MAQHPAVLIADDDDIFLTITGVMVNTHGLPVMKARDGIEAVDLYRAHADNIACVMLDIHMPHMDGIMAFRHLRKLRKDLPVIIASGDLTDSTLKQLASLSPVGYLKKPFSHQALADMLTECLGQLDS